MTRNHICRYCLAGHVVEVRSQYDYEGLEAIVPSLEPFRTAQQGDQPLFVMNIVDKEPDGPEYRNIGDFDTGNGNVRVDRCDASGDYRFLIRDVAAREAAMMWATADFAVCSCQLLCSGRWLRNFALNNALMMAYAFAGAKKSTLLVHASCVVAGKVAYAFVAKSGTGKSTQTGNWLKCFDDAELLNDDNPIVRVCDEGVCVYGSPWSGKTPCYRNASAPLGAVAAIVRDDKDFVAALPAAQALATVVAACSTMRWDRGIYAAVIDTVAKLLAQLPVYALHCLPHPESARVCRAGFEAPTPP